jgi:hypothetical protein
VRSFDVPDGDIVVVFAHVGIHASVVDASNAIAILIHGIAIIKVVKAQTGHVWGALVPDARRRCTLPA